MEREASHLTPILMSMTAGSSNSLSKSVISTYTDEAPESRATHKISRANEGMHTQIHILYTHSHTHTLIAALCYV